jgi:hypothetical protein
MGATKTFFVGASVLLALVSCADGGNDFEPITGVQTTLPPGLVRQGSGPDPTSISSVVQTYQADLGPLNSNEPRTLPGGRREINWDGVPDVLAAPNLLPFDFFNAEEAPRARGVELTTPGEGVQVSADAENPTNTPPRFGHINPTYQSQFRTFSGERLFSPVGSNVAEITFWLPGTKTPAVVKGFGAVYTDADGVDSASFEYFDAAGRSIGKYSVPASPDGMSFLGVSFDTPVVRKVRIVYGQTALGPDDGPGSDVAVMDDFIFGEPQAIPSVLYRGGSD